LEPLSLLHLLASLAALLTGSWMARLPKGDRRHRRLGWWYVALMATGLAGIIVARWSRPRPFVGYAVLTLAVLGLAVAASRLRARVGTWRAWHGALMSFTLLGAWVAAASIVGGGLIGDGSGAPFYRLFDALIAVGTVVVIINTRRVIWGRGGAERRSRRWYSALVAGSALALIAAQWRLAFG
jgi:uncharacterized membrane protein